MTDRDQPRNVDGSAATPPDDVTGTTPGSAAGEGEATRRLVPPTEQQPAPRTEQEPAQRDGGETQRLTPADLRPAEPQPNRLPTEERPAAAPAEGSTPEATAPERSAGTADATGADRPVDDEPVDDSPAEKERDEPDEGEPARPDSPDRVTAPWKRLSSAGALIWVLLLLFGFTLVVQLRANDSDTGLESARQEDLVRILSDLEARDTRLQAEIKALETSQRQLTSGVEGRQAALAEAAKRADELGLLAGTLPARGPGLRVSMVGVKASAVLNAVQELRGAGGEVMELAGTGGGAVRVVASTYFVDGDNGSLVVDGTRLTGPYTLWVIGSPQTMETALRIPGGVVASVDSDGGSVTMEQRTSVDVTAVRRATDLQYARPVS